MQKALSILAILTTHLPEIKQALDERWSAFAGQMQAQAASFENLVDEAALTEAANRLLGLLVTNETAHEIIVRPDSEVTKLPRPIVDEEIFLQTLANRFYLLCQGSDKLIEQGPDEFFKQADNLTQAAARARSDPEAQDASRERG